MNDNPNCKDALLGFLVLPLKIIFWLVMIPLMLAGAVCYIVFAGLSDIGSNTKKEWKFIMKGPGEKDDKN